MKTLLLLHRSWLKDLRQNCKIAKSVLRNIYHPLKGNKKSCCDLFRVHCLIKETENWGRLRIINSERSPGCSSAALARQPLQSWSAAAAAADTTWIGDILDLFLPKPWSISAATCRWTISICDKLKRGSITQKRYFFQTGLRVMYNDNNLEMNRNRRALFSFSLFDAWNLYARTAPIKNITVGVFVICNALIFVVSLVDYWLLASSTT